jgi:hypothetical protein
MIQQCLTIIIKKIRTKIKEIKKVDQRYSVDNSKLESKISDTCSLITEACRLLDKKFPTLDDARKYKYILLSYSKIKDFNYQNLESILENKNFQRLLKRKVEATYYLIPQVKEIYSPYLNDLLDCVRLPNRLLIENPYKAFEDNFSGFSIQSWSRPFLKSKPRKNQYNRHLKTSKNKDKSIFSVSNDIVVKMELIVFNQGYGKMNNEDQIYFYGRFSKEIGYLEDKESVSSYIRVQCDRARPKKGTGYCVEIHGYPVSLNDIKNDFSGCPINMCELIDKRQFQIPI